MNVDDDTATMSFGDHLEELRSRIIKAALIPIPLVFITYFFSGEILDWLCLPLRRALRAADLNDRLQVLGPAEALLTQIKISIIAAIILAAPWIFWQAWQFIRPGLYKAERRFVYFLLPGSAFMTVAGVCMLYFVMLPLVLLVLVNFGTVLDDELSLDSLRDQQEVINAAETGAIPILPELANPPAIADLKPGMFWLTHNNEIIIVIRSDRDTPTGEAAEALTGDDSNQPMQLEFRRILLTKSTALTQEFRLTTYINFVMMLMLGMVIAFQLPLVMLLLGWLNLLEASFCRANRKFALFGAAIFGAVLTPADPWSMMAMMLPLYLLYEFGIILMATLPASRIAGDAERRSL